MWIYIQRLHPKKLERILNLSRRPFITELEFDKLMPKHIKAKEISKFPRNLIKI